MKTTTEKELYDKLGEFVKMELWDTPNMASLQFKNGTVLQSYNTRVAANIGGLLYLFPEHTYSNTTNKHLIRYCGLNKNARIKALANGVAIYVE